MTRIDACNPISQGVDKRRLEVIVVVQFNPESDDRLDIVANPNVLPGAYELNQKLPLVS